MLGLDSPFSSPNGVADPFVPDSFSRLRGALFIGLLRDECAAFPARPAGIGQIFRLESWLAVAVDVPSRAGPTSVSPRRTEPRGKALAVPSLSNSSTTAQGAPPP